MENDKMETEIRLQIADVIINLNLIESKISDIISKYINSERQLFVREILLNSMIMNFSTKFKILKHILKSEKLNEPKDFFNAIHVIMNKRNVIAHSDSLLNFEFDVNVDCDWSHDNSFMYPIWSLELSLPIIENEEIKYQNVSKIVKDCIFRSILTTDSDLS